MAALLHQDTLLAGPVGASPGPGWMARAERLPPTADWEKPECCRVKDRMQWLCLDRFPSGVGRVQGPCPWQAVKWGSRVAALSYINGP